MPAPRKLKFTQMIENAKQIQLLLETFFARSLPLRDKPFLNKNPYNFHLRSPAQPTTQIFTRIETNIIRNMFLLNNKILEFE